MSKVVSSAYRGTNKIYDQEFFTKIPNEAAIQKDEFEGVYGIFTQDILDLKFPEVSFYLNIPPGDNVFGFNCLCWRESITIFFKKDDGVDVEHTLNAISSALGDFSERMQHHTKSEFYPYGDIHPADIYIHLEQLKFWIESIVRMFKIENFRIALNKISHEDIIKNTRNWIDTLDIVLAEFPSSFLYGYDTNFMIRGIASIMKEYIE